MHTDEWQPHLEQAQGATLADLGGAARGAGVCFDGAIVAPTRSAAGRDGAATATSERSRAAGICLAPAFGRVEHLSSATRAARLVPW